MKFGQLIEYNEEINTHQIVINTHTQTWLSKKTMSKALAKKFVSFLILFVLINLYIYIYIYSIYIEIRVEISYLPNIKKQNINRNETVVF